MENTGKIQPTLEQIQSFKGKYPKQLWYLFLVEMWERFTFYGMRSLLVYYIATLVVSADYHQAAPVDFDKVVTKYHTEKGEILDESHPMYYFETSEQSYKDDAEAFSNRQYGTIQAFIYAMAFLGGLFADRLFGFRRSIFWGGTLMAIGTFLMAIPGNLSFYIGISILIVGNGFFKPNISTMVGSLYKPGDPRRDAGFSLFYSGINIGAVLSGLTIAYVGSSVSWSLGFALAGVCMLLGLGIFIFTQKTLGPIGLPPKPEALSRKVGGINRGVLLMASTLLFIPVFFALIYFPVEFTVGEYIITGTDLIFLVAALGTISYIVYQIRKAEKEEARKLTVAGILILFSAIFWSFFEQGGGSLNYFAVGNVDGQGWNMLQVNNTINGLWVVIFAPLAGLFWLFLNRRKAEPNMIVKFGYGFIFLGLGFLVFFASRFLASEDGLTPLWTFMGAYLVITLGELCLSPIGLSMITKLSPQRLHGVMMGTWFLASAYGQYGAGLIGAALAKGGGDVENPSNFQKMLQYTSGYESIAYISVAAGIVLIALSPWLRKMMGGVK